MADLKKENILKLHPKLEKLMAGVSARMSAKEVFATSNAKQECINSGSTVLNLLIGGSRLPDGSFVCPGYPRGGITEIYGKESSGKTTLALTAVAQALAANGNTGTALYVDLEYAVKDKYAMNLGVDFRPPSLGGHGRVLRATPHDIEETEAIVNMAANGGIDIIVVDSVAALFSRRESERDTTNDKEKKQIAEVPRIMAAWMPKLQSIIARSKTCVIFINQTRDKIGAMGFTEDAKKTTTGGNALKFFSSARISLAPRTTSKASRMNPLTKETEDVPIATDVLVKMVKNKIDARQGHCGLITIRYGVGIDELRTTLNIAEAYGIVVHSKNGRKQSIFTFTSQKTGTKIEEIGIEKFRYELSSPRNASIYEEMSVLCTEKILEGFKAIDEKELANLESEAITKTYDNDDEDDNLNTPVNIIQESTDYSDLIDEGTEN